jgi:hypothetical protein
MATLNESFVIPNSKVTEQEVNKFVVVVVIVSCVWYYNQVLLGGVGEVHTIQFYTAH